MTMTRCTHCHQTLVFLDTFQRHVLSPLSTAIGISEQEQAEIDVEREAFEEFADQLEAITVDVKHTSQGISHRLGLHEPAPDSMASIRAAYRETVQEVPHYENVYGESLLENVAAELGPDLAHCLAPENSVSKTELVKNAFRNATAQVIQERREVSNTISEELDSLASAQCKLTDLIGELDSVNIPNWYQETFISRLDSIAAERQEIIQGHPTMLSSEGYDLCEYLYQDEPWTYPVLTAVTQVRESVMLS